MYLARFSYDVLPVNRQRAIDFIRREVEAARGKGLNSRMLVPLTRGHGGGPALQFEVELEGLDQLDQFRNRGVGSTEETGNWMHAFSEVLTQPPCVEILRIEDGKAA
jgi:hypothetical protein